MVAGHPVWPRGGSATLAIFFLNKIYDEGILRKKKKKKAKGIELPQFESLGGVKCHILNFGDKSANRWIFQGDKMYFLQYLLSRR